MRIVTPWLNAVMIVIPITMLIPVLIVMFIPAQVAPVIVVLVIVTIIAIPLRNCKDQSRRQHEEYYTGEQFAHGSGLFSSNRYHYILTSTFCPTSRLFNV
jgi:hypothetical protein